MKREAMRQWWRQLGTYVRSESWLIGLAAFVVLGLGGYYRVIATQWGLPYEYNWDEPEIINQAIRVLRDGVYRPTRYAYGPINAYIHAAWGVLSVLKAAEAGEISKVWDLKSDWDTGWYHTISSPVFYHQARLLSVAMWLVSVIALWQICRQMRMGPGAVAAVGVLTFSLMNFEQTTVVLPGVSATMFSALALWAALSYLSSEGSRPWTLAGSVAAAAAAVAAKLIFLPILAVPLLAYLGRGYIAKRPLRVGVVLGIVVGSCVGVALFMLPMFFDPPNFMQSMLMELTFYAKDASPMTFYRHCYQAALAGAAGVDAVVLRAVDGNLVPTHWRWAYGLWFLLGVGGWAVFLRRGWVGAVVLLPALANMWQVSGYQGEFYARNMFIAQLSLALGVGAAVDQLAKFLAKRFGKIAQPLSFVFAVLLLIVPAIRVATAALDRASAIDSRILAERAIDKLGVDRNKVLVAAELHWFFSAVQEASKPKFTQISVVRLFRHPEEAQGYQFVLVPLQLNVNDNAAQIKQDIEIWNRELAKLKPLETYGVKDTFLDRHSVNPRLAIVPTSEFRAAVRAGAPRIYGLELFNPATEKAAFASRFGIAVRNYFLGSTLVKLEKPTKEVIVKGRNLNPFAEFEAPMVNVRVHATTDTLFKAPVADLAFELSRGGMPEYSRKVQIPAGEYVVRVSAKNPNPRFMTELAYVEFR
jgi:hypothetical protein